MVVFTSTFFVPWCHIGSVNMVGCLQNPCLKAGSFAMEPRMLSSSWVRHAMKQSAIMLAGSALYALAIYLTAIVNIPGSDNVQLRPGVAIPILCGALFGPVAGFVTG